MLIVPFRGEYYDLAAARQQSGAGIDLSRAGSEISISGCPFHAANPGNVDAGPNAVLAFRREGYRRGDFDLGEAMEIHGYGISSDGAPALEERPR